MNLLTEGVGAIRDWQTVNILLKDPRLEKKLITLPEELSKEKLLLLTFEQKEGIKQKEELYTFFWNGSSSKPLLKGRQYVSGKSVELCPELCVSGLPFQEKTGRETFLLSPISQTACENVKEHLRKGKKIDYDIFRRFVWGDKGLESQEYHMLLDWVVRHQREAGRYTKKEIADMYEDLLHEIYRQCVHRM